MCFFLCCPFMCLLLFLRFMFHCWSTNIGRNQVDSTTSTDFVRCFCRIFTIIVLIEIFPLTRPSFLMHHRYATVLLHQFPLSLLSPIYSIFHSMKIKFFFSPFMAPFIGWAFHFFMRQQHFFWTDRKAFLSVLISNRKHFFPFLNHRRRSRTAFRKDNNWLWTLSSIYHFASFLPTFPCFFIASYNGIVEDCS